MTEPERPASPPSEREHAHEERWQAAKASALGLQFGISVAIGAAAGHWLDQHFGWGSKGVVGGVLLGSAAAFADMIRFAKRASEK
ncbi:MAG: AtpZ/AtpI family protein [Myxococcales bacterium]|nr:AtpZ/AtpI family protein [Myxococcales bacterium]MCB9520759.1 AtpZ/AtpI family protein [Myxococcales bacterium]MCB9533476.1 AtpZ/AtpI family protein [Myxococcales bacterium]